MAVKRPRSLRNLIMIHEIAFLFLVTVTGLLGGLSAYFWQQNSAESLRINNLAYITEQIRSELFRQIQEVIRARVLEDPRALDVYGEYSRRIDRHFNNLRQSAITSEEDKDIQALQVSYREIQIDMNKIFADPYVANQQVRMRILDPGFAQRMVGVFEGKYGNMKSILNSEHQFLDQKLARWTRYAPVIITITLILAVLLVIYARLILNKGFIDPMSKVIQGAKIFSQGKLKHRISANGVEEVSELANTFNGMAKDLENSRYALVESEKQAALGALIPVVAHNIRNPLASIRATAQVLEDVDDKEELRECSKAIIDTIDRLGRWVNSLVSYLHPLKPNYRLVYVSHMLEAVLKLLKDRIADKNIQIEKYGWENDLRLNADPDLMEQAIYAICNNAIEASPDDTTIRIGMEKIDSRMVIHIQDSGPGLPFKPSPNELAPGPTTKRFGTGLGIPIAYKICQQHSWKLEFISTKDRGTDVTITAPIRVLEEEVE